MESDRKAPALKKLYYTIGEVSQLTGVPAHVLRYWESEFPQLRPKKSRAGNRVYQERELETVLRIKGLLYERQFTIAGARRELGGGDGAGADGHRELLDEVRRELHDILRILANDSGRGAAR